MDFFQYQEDARKRTRQLVVYYALAVALIIGAVYLVLAVGLLYGQSPEGQPVDHGDIWHLELFLWTAVIVGGVIGLGTLYKVSSLSGGGKSVARMMGGKPIPSDTSDPDERRVLNVVEEMAIASGTPVPPVYILDEDGINAFAAGFRASDAVIGVTRGCVEKLNRDELQGVIAHEFSHILNGDMRLNIRLIGVLFGILLITFIGQVLMRIGLYSGMSGGRRRSSSSRGGGNGLPLAIMFLGIALLIIGSIGVFFGRLIKSAVSRQREFLADAAAVQFTRNPDGLAGALKKIGGYTSKVNSVHSEEASHMFFANSLKSSLGGLLATHPPLKTRIRRLDESFKQMQEFERGEAEKGRTAQVSEMAGGSALTSAESGGFSAGQMVAAIGAMRPENLSAASRLIDKIPQSLRDQVHSSSGARAAVYCLLLSKESQVLEKQLEIIKRNTDEATLQSFQLQRQQASQLEPAARMPLVDLALTALQQQNPNDYRQFKQTVEELIAADNRVGVFEFALSQSLLRNLEPVYGRPEKPKTIHTQMSPKVISFCLPLLAFLARYGNEDNEQQAAADFYAGVKELGVDPNQYAMPNTDSDPVRVFRESLEQLRETASGIKKQVVNACAAAVIGNRSVTAREADLLRAVADSLDCPLPPIVA